MAQGRGADSVGRWPEERRSPRARPRGDCGRLPIKSRPSNPPTTPASPPGLNGPDGASSGDRSGLMPRTGQTGRGACWCPISAVGAIGRGLVCSDEWEPLQPTDDDVPLDQQTAGVCSRLGRRGLGRPLRRRRGRVPRVGVRKGDQAKAAAGRVPRDRPKGLRQRSAGDSESSTWIPSSSWWIFVTGRLRPEGRPQRGICWDRVKVFVGTPF